MKHVALINTDRIIFLLKEKKKPSAIKVQIILFNKLASSKMPTGNKIILVITAAITAIETHLIQSKIGLSGFMFLELKTPKARQK